MIDGLKFQAHNGEERLSSMLGKWGLGRGVNMSHAHYIPHAWNYALKGRTQYYNLDMLLYSIDNKIELARHVPTPNCTFFNQPPAGMLDLPL